jgi:hypothetical protein
MRAPRRAATTLAALSLLILAVSCGDDDDSTSATTTEPASEKEPASLYRAGLVLAKGKRTDDRQIQPPAGLTALNGDGLAGVLGFGSSDNDPARADAAASLDRLLNTESLTAYSFDASLDPLGVAQAIEKENEGVQASPVLLTTISGHWTFAPGTKPDDGHNDPGTVDWEQAAEPDVPVGVVDTGYTESQTTPWLTGRVDPVDANIDADRTPMANLAHGHGMFVGSLIAQQAPQAAVTEARLTDIGIGTETFYGSVPEAIKEGFASDELQLYVAIDRLVTTKQAFKALNLSLGSYGTAEGDPFDSGFAILGAVNLWNRTYNEPEETAPILAAAGNHEIGKAQSTQPFLPAAYGPKYNVQAIASVDKSGTMSEFSNDADIKALGQDVLGIRDDSLAWTSWGGTSFATAVATAATVNNAPISDMPSNIATAP